MLSNIRELEDLWASSMGMTPDAGTRGGRKTLEHLPATTNHTPVRQQAGCQGKDMPPGGQAGGHQAEGERQLREAERLSEEVEKRESKRESKACRTK